MATSSARRAQFLKQEVLTSVVSRIAVVRAKESLTQAETAEMLGMTQPRLSALVQGHLELFSLEALIEVASKLGLTVRLNISRPYKSS